MTERNVLMIDLMKEKLPSLIGDPSKQSNKGKMTKPEDLIRLYDGIIKSTELEPHKERRDPEHQNKKPNPSLNEEDGINQSQIKEKLIKFSNQSHRHHSDIDTTAIEQS